MFQGTSAPPQPNKNPSSTNDSYFITKNKEEESEDDGLNSLFHLEDLGECKKVSYFKIWPTSGYVKYVPL